MRKTRKTTRTAALLGLLASAALVALTSVATTTAATQAAPANVDPPTITGTATVGEVLTAHNGTWDNSPTDFRYRWLRCNSSGSGCLLLAADGQTYRLGQVDVGHTMRVRVTAINADGATNARSQPSDIVASNAARGCSSMYLKIAGSEATSKTKLFDCGLITG